MKPSVNNNGYYIVNFMVDEHRTGHQVHVLVAKQFIQNPENKATVNHIDGNKLNNHIENLEWATQSEQAYHSVYVLGNNPSKWCSKKIAGFEKNTGEKMYEFNSLAEAGRYFANGKNYRYYQNSICRVMHGLRKSYKRCIWKYI